MSLLEIRNLSKEFGGVRAINQLDLDVRRGEILGVIGPNGAGKTTLFSMIAGFLSPTSGTIVFDGANITGVAPHKIARRGIVRTFQKTTLWREFTVLDNMQVALHMKSEVGILGSIANLPSVREKENNVLERGIELLRFLGMDHLKDQIAGTLSHGYQKTLSFGIGAATAPPLVLLDEPVCALNPERVRHIMGLIGYLREAGSTVMIIEHHMKAIFGVCDRIVVINYGNKIAEGRPSEIKEDSVVISAYLGVKKGVA